MQRLRRTTASTVPAPVPRNAGAARATRPANARFMGGVLLRRRPGPQDTVPSGTRGAGAARQNRATVTPATPPMIRLLLSACLLCAAAVTHAVEPARVMVVGTYHFANPGHDLHNVAADDVTTPARQAELQAVTDALAKFEPTVVAVEWPAAEADAAYVQYLDGSLAPTANEVVQLGFRLARQRGLALVHGIDVAGEFPYGELRAWAEANGRSAELDALQQQAQAITEDITARQATQSIGAVLRHMNAPAFNRDSHGFYARMLRYGAGDAQPGVALVAAWERRNLAICARLLQSLQPGDRAVVFYGQGHAYLLQRCFAEMPGVEVVEANDYLP